MIRMTRMPEEGTRRLAPLKPSFSSRHYLVFCWLLVAHLVCFGKATVQGLARYTPSRVAAGHLRRLLAAGRWPWARVLEWLVSAALAAVPPPKDGVLYLVVDSTLKNKRSQKKPLAKKGRLNEYAPYTFGLHVGILLAQWDVYRVPLAFRLVKPQGSPGYQAENALFREMRQEVILPAWCKQVIVVADAAYPSRANLQAIQARQWFFVIAPGRPQESHHQSPTDPDVNLAAHPARASPPRITSRRYADAKSSSSSHWLGWLSLFLS